MAVKRATRVWHADRKKMRGESLRENMLMIISQVLLYFFFHRVSPRTPVITITVIVLMTIVIVILMVIIILGTVKGRARVWGIFLSSRHVKSRNP